VGIYSRPVKLHDRVHDGDRVEIYRPLIADRKSCVASGRKAPEVTVARLSDIKKALIERFLLLIPY
jgi:putative ubiquitin-RnfH superfamily antitoxin RatB of RatAB toxin-antitoxin module